MADNNKIVHVYLKMRAKKSELTKEYNKAVAELDAQMATLEGALGLSLREAKVNSMGTDEGTFFKELKVRSTCTDWNGYFQWMAAEQAWEGIEKRVGQNFIKDYLENVSEVAPPGITVLREYVVRVRAK